MGVALFGQLRGQVLALLYGAPESQLYLREMARITGASPGALQREVKLLVDAGLLLWERRGHQVFYRAHSSAPVFHDLSGVIRKTMSVEDTIRSVLSPLANRLKAAVIFGSMARGDLGPGSDIDLLVVGTWRFRSYWRCSGRLNTIWAERLM